MFINSVKAVVIIPVLFARQVFAKNLCQNRVFPLSAYPPLSTMSPLFQ